MMLVDTLADMANASMLLAFDEAELPTHLTVISASLFLFICLAFLHLPSKAETPAMGLNHRAG